MSMSKSEKTAAALKKFELPLPSSMISKKEDDADQIVADDQNEHTSENLLEDFHPRRHRRIRRDGPDYDTTRRGNRRGEWRSLSPNRFPESSSLLKSATSPLSSGRIAGDVPSASEQRQSTTSTTPLGTKKLANQYSKLWAIAGETQELLVGSGGTSSKTNASFSVNGHSNERFAQEREGGMRHRRSKSSDGEILTTNGGRNSTWGGMNNTSNSLKSSLHRKKDGSSHHHHHHRSRRHHNKSLSPTLSRGTAATATDPERFKVDWELFPPQAGVVADSSTVKLTPSTQNFLDGLAVIQSGKTPNILDLLRSDLESHNEKSAG